MFIVKNDPATDRGEYFFAGKPVLSNRITLLYSNAEVQQILKQIQIYTHIPRDYCLILENEEGERVYAYDHLTIDEIIEKRKNNQEVDNHFTVLAEGELPIG